MILEYRDKSLHEASRVQTLRIFLGNGQVQRKWDSQHHSQSLQALVRVSRTHRQADSPWENSHILLNRVIKTDAHLSEAPLIWQRVLTGWILWIQCLNGHHSTQHSNSQTWSNPFRKQQIWILNKLSSKFRLCWTLHEPNWQRLTQKLISLNERMKHSFKKLIEHKDRRNKYRIRIKSSKLN